jgi:hydroxypyruvate isomerase
MMFNEVPFLDSLSAAAAAGFPTMDGLAWSKGDWRR